MKLENLKKGFFGYQKASVYQYIASVEEEFSAKLMEMDAQTKKNEEQYQTRIQQLEEELSAVRKQMNSQTNEQMLIAHTMMDAKRFAESLKKETEEKEREARHLLQEEIAKKNQEITQYYAQIQDIRETFRSILNEMDGKAEKLEQHIQAINETCPDQNMSLFQRKENPEK